MVKIKRTPRKDIIYDGIKFDSQLEVYCYKELKSHGIQFEYHPNTFELIPSFNATHDSYEADKRVGGELTVKSRKIHNVKYTTDFKGEWWVIETKGYKKDTFMIRWKMFRKYLTDNNLEYTLFMPQNRKQVNQTIQIILNHD